MRCFPDWSPCAPSRGRETGVSEVDTCTVSHVRSVHTITLNTRVSIQLTSKCAEVQMSLTRDGIGDIHCHYHTAQIRRSTHYRSRRARFRSTFDLASTQVRVAPHICLRYLLLLQHALAYFIGESATESPEADSRSVSRGSISYAPPPVAWHAERA